MRSLVAQPLPWTGGRHGAIILMGTDGTER